jgi:hypothetical protein
LQKSKVQLGAVDAFRNLPILAAAAGRRRAAPAAGGRALARVGVRGRRSDGEHGQGSLNQRDQLLTLMITTKQNAQIEKFRNNWNVLLTTIAAKTLLKFILDSSLLSFSHEN